MDLMCCTCTMNARVISMASSFPNSTKPLLRLVSSDILGDGFPGRLLPTAPHGPEFVRQLPSMEAWNFHHKYMSSMSSFPCSCWSLVQDFDETSLLQYCGALADILILPSSYSSYSSISCMLMSLSPSHWHMGMCLYL